MVGASELSQQLFPQFASVQFPGAIAYRKATPGPLLQTVFPYEASPFQKTTVQPSVNLPVWDEQPAPKFQFHEDEKTRAVVNELPVQKENIAVLEQPAQATDLETSEKIAEETSPSKALSIRALADQGKLPEALALCEDALASDKLDPGLHFLRAIILQELNRIDEAGVSLKRTLYLDQNFVLAHFAMGNIVLRQGKAPAAAKKHFENVLTLLKECKPDEILPESEGLTAGRFREIIQATMETGALA
jgi:chemotaxis protein methyltransferase CheR